MASQEASLSNLNIVSNKHKKAADYQAALVEYDGVILIVLLQTLL